MNYFKFLNFCLFVSSGCLLLLTKVYRKIYCPTQDLLLQNLVQQCFLGFLRRLPLLLSPESNLSLAARFLFPTNGTKCVYQINNMLVFNYYVFSFISLFSCFLGIYVFEIIQWNASCPGPSHSFLSQHHISITHFPIEVSIICIYQLSQHVLTSLFNLLLIKKINSWACIYM